MSSAPLFTSFLQASAVHEQTALRLLGDLPAEQWTRQPGGLPNHAAWTLAHLGHYHPALLSLARGEPVSDPGQHPDAGRFDAGATPIDDPQAYPTPTTLLATYRDGHQRIREALQSAPAERLLEPPGLARWQKGFPQTHQALMYLLVLHEGYHLGQLMSWRRALGLPAVDG